MISILYTDDELQLLEVVKLFLERKKEFSVDTTSSVTEAFKSLSIKKYDLILSDYQMPEKDGIEFLKELRSSGNTIPFIIFTGKGREEIVIEAINSGADFYLQKGTDLPALFVELSHKIRQAVKVHRADIELIKSEEKYRLLFENMIEGFALHEIITDNKGKPVDYRFLAVNTAFEQMTGLSRNEIIGKTAREVIPDTEENWIEIYGDVAVKGEQKRIENYNRDLAKWYDILAYSPRYTQFATILIDITAKKKLFDSLIKSEERYRSLFENLNEGFAYCKMVFEGKKPIDFIYLEVNPAFEKLTGLSNVVGKKVTDVIPGIYESDPGLFEIYGKVSLAGTPEKFEIFLNSLKICFRMSVYSPGKGYFISVFDSDNERKLTDKSQNLH